MLIKKALFIIPAALLLSFPVSAEITPNPVISRDCPAYSDTGQSTAYAANDSVYYSFWFGNSPAYLAYDLSAVPENQREKIIAVW